MADSDDSAAVCGRPAAVCAAAHRKLNAVREQLEKGLADLKSLERKNATFDGKKDANASNTSFKLSGAVQQSRLLSLAPEIRNMIWKLCLFHPEDLVVKLDDKRKDVGKKYGCLTMTVDTDCDEARPKLREAYEGSVAKRTRQSIREHSLRNLALMQTCQAIYNETAPVLWSQRFYFHSILHLEAFLFSNARLDLVRDIFVWTLDRQCGVNYMPAVSALLAEKVKGLERFDVDMSHMDKFGLIRGGRSISFQDLTEVREAGTKLGFDVYSCMHPWVTKVVRDQGIERLMAILQIPKDSEKVPQRIGTMVFSSSWRTHNAFSGRGRLNAGQQRTADTATAREILRLVNLYDK